MWCDVEEFRPMHAIRMFLVSVLHSTSIFNYRTRLMHFYGFAKKIICMELEKCSVKKTMIVIVDEEESSVL